MFYNKDKKHKYVLDKRYNKTNLHRTLMKDWQYIEPMKMVEVFSLWFEQQTITLRRECNLLKSQLQAKGLKILR